MGLGKALGGILSDAYSVRKIGFISIIASLPFLVFGDNNMYISLIGIMLFSMTMAVTLGLIVSVLKKFPGLAFGYTTIGLFLGTMPVFFFKFTDTMSNVIVITLLSVICCIISLCILSKEEKNEC